MPEDQNIKTYGDLKAIVGKIQNKQLKDKIVSQGKSIAIDQLLGLIPGAQNVKSVVDFVSAATKRPDTKKTNTWLDKLDIDDQVSAIVDDTVENGYVSDLTKNIQTKSDDENLPDDFSATSDLQKYIANKYQDRTVSSPEITREGKEILKELLLVELEDMKSFDEDPMGFILRKYVSLNQTMVELMTRAYRDYLYGVYIVAPKPTTFKIVLHNKQYFYLMYLGPTYQASVAGKNYYLSDLGEKERCIVAISKLLRGGAPINTKGPEGAEQGAKDETGGGGGGGSTSGGGGGGEESGGGEGELSASPEGGEGGGEEPEELTENAKMVLKLLLEQELDKIEKSPEEQDSDKEKKGEGTQKGKESKKKSKFPETPILSSNNINPQALGLQNSTYKNSQELITIVKSAITKKIVGKDQKQVENTKNFLFSLCEDVENSSTDSKLTDGIETINFSKKTIEALSGINRKDLNTIGIEFGEVLGAIYSIKKNYASDKNIIFPSQQNNPIFDFRLQKNEDEYINVSSKYKKGASSSLRQVVKENIENSGKLQISEETFNFLNILNNSYKKSVSISYLYIAKSLNDEKIEIAFTAAKKELGIEIDISKEDEKIKTHINDTLKTIREKEGNDALTQRLNNFYDKIGRKKVEDGEQIKWHKLPTTGKEESIIYYGLVTSPIAYFLTSVINKGEGKEDYKALLSGMIRNTEIKQLRLNFLLREKSAKFNSQSSKNEDANFFFFPGKISSNDPEKGFMSFRME